MDELTRPVARFTPDRRVTAAAAAGVVVAVLLAVTSGDAPGRLLFTLAALLLVAYVVSDLVWSPRLIVDADGLVIRSPFARAAVGWDQVESVRADNRIRYGLRSTTLEIDAGATLAVLSRRALGADPAVAAEVVAAFRPPR